MPSKKFEILTPLSDIALANGRDVFTHYKKESTLDDQLLVAMEECGELVQAITKLQRVAGDDNMTDKAKENLASEIADVRIMLNQLTYMTGSDANVAEQIEYKLGRQRKRIEGNTCPVSGF